MKRYWLFGGTFWDYASGGMADLIDCYDTEQEARAGSFTAWPYGNGNGYFTLE